MESAFFETLPIDFRLQKFINGLALASYLSTHTAMLDTLGYRTLTSKAILAHTIGGIVAAVLAHWLFVLYGLI